MTDDHSITNLNSAAANFHRAQRDLNRVALLNELRVAGDTGATTGELADRIGLAKTTANRQLKALLDQSLVERGDDGRFRILPTADTTADVDHGSTDSAGIDTEGATLHTDNTSPATDDPVDVHEHVDQDGRGDRPDWPRWANTAVNQLDAGGRRVARFFHADPEGAARLVVSAIGAVAIGLLALIVVIQLIGWADNGNPLQDLAGILPARELVTDPLQRWLDVHTAGTGISVETAAWTWGITGAVMWFFACCHQLGAQLAAWPAFGTATAAMAWFGTTTAAHRPVAAGLIAITWFVLSLFALNRRPRPRPRYVINREPATDAKEAV